MSMFFDWLHLEQDFHYTLPILSDVALARLRVINGSITGEAADHFLQPAFHHRGSHCDTLKVQIRGSVLIVSGNPSRWGRVENLFGLQTIDACVAVFNQIMAELGLPAFTKCTHVGYRQPVDSALIEQYVDGAIIKEIHITTNKIVGQGNVRDYISGLSTLTYRNSVPNLHPNGCTVDWKSKQGNANLIYPCVYDKANELTLHSLSKIKNKFGDKSPEYNYLLRVIELCESLGVARFEQKLKSRYLQRENLHHYGLSDFSKLNQLQNNFITLDSKLQVTAMDFETISEQLFTAGAVDTVRAANTTAMYAVQWAHGQTFDFNKTQIITHRARLRKIGIDIAQRIDITRFSPVKVVATREIAPQVMSFESMPAWYIKPNHLRAA